MHNTILLSLTLLLLPVTASAQFYTITKDSDLMPDTGKETMQTVAKEMIQSATLRKVSETTPCT